MKNPAFQTLQQVRGLLSSQYGTEYGNTAFDSLDYALVHAPQTSALRILHPLFFKEWREPRRRTADKPVSTIGFDIETVAQTGVHGKAGTPKLFGFSYEDGTYYYDDNPTLGSFIRVLKSIRNTSEAHLAVWSRLDIQVVLRLFSPNEKERLAISAGLSGKSRNGEIIVPYSCQRTLRDGTVVFVGHYIPGRSLRIGWFEGQYERSIWIYNMAHFYRGRIADVAPTLGLAWTTFDKETHVIDWTRFESNPKYRAICLASNEQDARVVRQLAMRLQDDFYSVFKTYPLQLVSTGSLADAAVSALLSDEDYNATSGIWLKRNILGTNNDASTKLDSLLGEAFSAGYVDQYAIGYFPQVCTADISAAYPDKIRKLPDLRYAVLQAGEGKLEDDLREMQAQGLEIESAIIRGLVSIPSTLPYHPITVRNRFRQNYRPIGTFRAAYTLDERNFCVRYGATFADEEYVIVGLSKRVPSPIADVSRRLGIMRSEITAERDKHAKDTAEWRTYNAQQEMVKLVDNSLYGKTTMTLESMELIAGKPRLVGYVTGDRYNALLATLITARTRTQLADACMTIWRNGGAPIMCMTDALYWDGTTEMLPSDLWSEKKTAGFFEKPTIEHDFFLLKTGQYEYRVDDKYVYKLRGIPAQYERDELGPYIMFNGQKLRPTNSFFRDLIRQYAAEHTETIDTQKVCVEIPTRKLATIGQPDSELLGAVLESTMKLRPFAMSTKTEQFPFDWRECIDGHVWIPQIKANALDAFPYAVLQREYENGIAQHVAKYRARKKKINKRTDNLNLHLF